MTPIFVAPRCVRLYVIPAVFAALCIACVLADIRLGTPWWMIALEDMVLFPTVGAITVLVLTPGIEHLRNAKLRMAALGERVGRIIARKLVLRVLIAAPGR